jgi:hypothetical protein
MHSRARLRIRQRLGLLATALVAVLILLVPGGAPGTSVAAPLIQKPPFPGVWATENVSRVSGPGGCAATRVLLPPSFNAASGVARLSASLKVSTSCTGWASGSSFGANSTSAAADLNLTVSAPLNASAVLGHNVTSGTVSATESWNLSIGAYEGFYHRTGHCADPYRTTWFYGCQGWSSYFFSVDLSVWDNTTHATVAPSGQGPGSWWGFGHDKISCTHWGSYCGEHGTNASTKRSVPLALGFVGTLNATNQYFLVTTFTAYLMVYLVGWQGAGSVGVDMSTHGHGADLTRITLS